MALQEELDRCVSCGFCLPACPTYELHDNEVYSPRGRIALMRLLQSGELEPTEEALATYDDCLGCRACESACPSGVHYETIFLAGRERLAEARQSSRNERRILKALRSPSALRRLRALWASVGGALRSFARTFARRSGPLALMAVMPKSGRQPHAAKNPGVWLHEGCIMSVAFSETNARAQDLIERQGAVCGGSGPLCCGALHGHAGNMADARAMARTVIEAFSQSGARQVVSTAGGCGAWLKGYGELLEGDPEWRERARAFSASVCDVSEWLVQSGYRPRRRENLRLTYQDSCHLRHGQKTVQAPRLLLAELGDYVELEGADRCCGSAGIYNVTREDGADAVLERKMAKVKSTPADVLVTANPGCELQLKNGVRRDGLPMRVTHIVDLLYEAELAP